MGGLNATLFAGAVGGSTLALVAMAVAATWLSGWYEERARRASSAVRRGARLRRGFGAIHGTARRLHDGGDPAVTMGASPPNPRPATGVHDGGDLHTPATGVDGRPGGRLVATTLTQIRFGRGAWRDAGRVTEGSPFALVLGGGEEIEVDPRDAVVEGGPAEIQGHAYSRDLVFLVSAGDAVWATGILAPRREQGAGAYRSGVARARLGAPRRGRITLSRESPVPRWRELAAAHKTGAYLAAGFGALLHAVLFARFDLALVFHRELDRSFDHVATGPLAIFAGLVALLIAALAWRKRVVRARGAAYAD